MGFICDWWGSGFSRRRKRRESRVGVMVVVGMRGGVRVGGGLTGGYRGEGGGELVGDLGQPSCDNSGHDKRWRGLDKHNIPTP